AHRPEIALGRGAIERVRLACRIVGTAVDLDGRGHPAAADREMIDDGDVANAGNRADALEDLPIETGVRVRVVVLRVRRHEADGDAILRRESEIDALQLVEAANEEPGADE